MICEMKIRRTKIVLGGFVLFLIALVILADTGHAQNLFGLVQKVPGGDKTGHFLLFGALSFLVNLLMRASEFQLGRVRLLKGSCLVMAIVTIEECSQMLFRSRTFEVLDLTADALGIVVCGWLARKYLNWVRSRSQAEVKTL